MYQEMQEIEAKVAVYSQNENIDPVGSCVGQKKEFVFKTL